MSNCLITRWLMRRYGVGSERMRVLQANEIDELTIAGNARNDKNAGKCTHVQAPEMSVRRSVR